MLSGVAGISVVSKGSPLGVVMAMRSLLPWRVFSHQMIAVMFPAIAFVNRTLATCMLAFTLPLLSSLR